MTNIYRQMLCAIIGVVLVSCCDSSFINPNESKILDKVELVKFESLALKGDDSAADKVAMHLGAVGDENGLKDWISQVARTGSVKYGNMRVRQILRDAKISVDIEKRYCLLVAARDHSLSVMRASKNEIDSREAQISFNDSTDMLLKYKGIKKWMR